MMRKIKSDIYTRLSSIKQEDGMSKETQELECKKYCNEAGYEIRKIYYENHSAMTPQKREIFKAMIERQKSKDRADVIVCYSLDRLTRNQVDFYAIRELVDDFNCKIVLVKENIVLEKPFKSYEKFLLGVLVCNAEYEVAHMNEIRKKGLCARAKTGIRPCKLPYGYKKRGKHIVIIPSEANFVRKAFELYETGLYSLSKLPEVLYEEGYLYKNQRNYKIPRASLAAMLKNLFYTGSYYYPDCEKLIKGQYKLIISKELYQKVQSVLKRSGVECRKTHNFLYSKMIVLQDTNTFLSGEIKKEKYIYYSAIDSSQKAHRVNENEITDSVFNYFKEIRLKMIPQELVQAVLKDVLAPHKQMYSILKRAVSHKYQKEQRLYDFVNKNKIKDINYITDASSEIENTYGDLDYRIKKQEKLIETISEKCLELSQKRLYDSYIQLDEKNQRKILELVKNKFELQDKKIKLTFKSSFRKIRKR